MNNTLIPRDVLLYLATFLDPFTGNSLRLTCKFLHSILANTYEKPVHFEIIYDQTNERFYSMLANFSEYGSFGIPAFVYVNELLNETIYEFAWYWDANANYVIHHINNENFAYFTIRSTSYWPPKLDTKFIITLKTTQKILDESKRLISCHPRNSMIRKYKKHDYSSLGSRRLWNI